MSTCDPNRGCPPSVPNVHCAYPKCAHGEAKNPTPVSATEQADKALRFDLDRAGIEQREAEAVELVTLRARLAEAERVTEEQVERACVAVAAANQTPWPTGDVAFDRRIRRRMHTALTAARGGG